MTRSSGAESAAGSEVEREDPVDGKAVVAQGDVWNGRRNLNLRFLGWLAIAAATISLLAVSVIDAGGVENDAMRIQRLSEAYACPVCAGQSVAESNAEVAQTIRQQIRAEVQQDASDDEIRDLLITQYGGEVLLNPPANGIASLVWVLPVVVVVLGAAGVGAVVTGRRGPEIAATDEDKQLVAAALAATTDQLGTPDQESDDEEEE